MEPLYLEEGSVLDGRYRILSIKRESKDGFLYNAINTLTENEVVIKEYFPSACIREENQEVRAVKGMEETTFEMQKKRFLKEARILKDYREFPGIVRILDYFEANGTVYCVLEKTEGVLLSDRLKGMPKGRMNPKSAFQGMIPILRSLVKIHEAGFLIRMIRPDSIEVTKNHGFSICDFGVPKEIETAGQQENKRKDRLHDETNATKLTVFEADAFTAPERMDTETKQGPWSDLYSVAAVLYFCITGQEPESAYERILGERLSSTSDLGIQINEAAEQVLMKGLAIKAKERYQNADEMLADIRRIYPEENQTNKKKRWKRRIVTAAAVAGTVLFCAGLFFYFHPAILKFHGIETETVWLEPAKNANEKTVKQDWKIIRQRVRVFAGKEGYIWQKRGKNVLLILPESLFEEQGSRSSIQDYLLDPWNLYAQRKSVSIKEIKDKKTGIMPGYKEFLEYERRMSYDSRPVELPEEGRYLRVKVTPKLRKMIEQEIEKFSSLTDSEADTEKTAKKMADSETTWITRDEIFEREEQSSSEQLYWGLSTNFFAVHLDQDSRYLDITGQLQSEPFFRVMAYNLTHKGPQNEFYAYAEQKIKWESPGKGAAKGKYQKKAEYPIRKPVYLTYLNVYSGKVDQESTGEWERKITNFKEMLDILKTPYAIGISKDNNREIFVKIDRTKIPEFYAESLDNSVQADIGCGWSSLNEGYNYQVKAAKEKGGKRAIHLQISDDGLAYGLDRLKEKTQIARKNGVKEIRLLVGGTEVAKGELEQQKDLKKGILVFDKIVLPNSKEKDIEKISRCMNKLNHVESDQGSAYSLIGTQNISKNGLPVSDQSSLPIGGDKILTENEKKKIEKIAKKNNLDVSIVEHLSSHTLNFDNYAQADNAEGSDEAFIRASIATVEELIRRSMNETQIKDTFWNGVNVTLYSSDQKVRIEAALKPENEILYKYNGDEKEEKADDDLGKIAIHGQIYELGDSTSLESLKWMPLNEAANTAKYSDAAAAKKYIDQSKFFKKYGGSDTWEYGAGDVSMMN